MMNNTFSGFFVVTAKEFIRHINDHLLVSTSIFKGAIFYLDLVNNLRTSPLFSNVCPAKAHRKSVHIGFIPVFSLDNRKALSAIFCSQSKMMKCGSEADSLLEHSADHEVD